MNSKPVAVPFSELVVDNCYRVEHNAGVLTPGENGYESNTEGTDTRIGKLLSKTEKSYTIMDAEGNAHTGPYRMKNDKPNKIFYEIPCHSTRGGRRSRRNKKSRSYRRSYRRSRKN